MDAIYQMLEELRPEYDYRESSDFIEDGLLDSFDIISLIDMISEKYGVSIDGLDIVPENFCTAQAISELIKKNGGSI